MNRLCVDDDDDDELNKYFSTTVCKDYFFLWLLLTFAVFIKGKIMKSSSVSYVVLNCKSTRA